MRYSKTRETFNPHQYHITTIPCPQCRGTEEITVEGADLFAYNQGAYIQDAFPYLSNAQRERFISGMCDPCFDKLFGEEE